MNKQILMEKLNISYSNIEQVISRLTEMQMIDSLVKENRTPKDIIGHIAAWNWNGIEWVKSLAEGKNPKLPMEGHMLEERDAIFAALNEEIYHKNQGKTLKEILDDHRRSWTTLMSLVETLTEEDLQRTINLDWAANPFPGWTVVAWRIQHADNHMNQISEWIKDRSDK